MKTIVWLNEGGIYRQIFEQDGEILNPSNVECFESAIEIAGYGKCLIERMFVCNDNRHISVSVLNPKPQTPKAC